MVVVFRTSALTNICSTFGTPGVVVFRTSALLRTYDQVLRNSPEHTFVKSGVYPTFLQKNTKKCIFFQKNLAMSSFCSNFAGFFVFRLEKDARRQRMKGERL